jgi:sugar phosphate isomerase/epimerase
MIPGAITFRKEGKMKRNVLAILALTVLASAFAAARPLGSGQEDDLSQVRIKKFPVAMQCWTYRKYSFFEAVEKTKALGIKYLQAYPGQPLSKEDSRVLFDHSLTDSQIEKVRQKLAEAGMEVIGYGVVDIGRTEAEMRPAFEFARKMGIQVIATEPQDGDFRVLDKLVKEYDVRIAVHNHPSRPSMRGPDSSRPR